MSDLISRQAAIKAIEDLQDCYNGFSDTYDKACIIGMIEEVPSIEPIKHGHWINDNGLYKCSVCNEFTITGWANCIPIEQMNKAMKYCNNCGARMDGEDNG